MSFSINHSIYLLVIVFHQSATADTRGNLDFAAERQNCAQMFMGVSVYILVTFMC